MEDFSHIFINDFELIKKENIELKIRVQHLEDNLDKIKQMLFTIINNKNIKKDNIKEIIFIQKFFKNQLYKKNIKFKFYKLYFSFKKWCYNIKLIKKTNKDIMCKIKSNKIWYMNGNYEDIKIWDTFVKNKIVLTWNQNGRNETIKTKLKKNHIIAWYMRKNGFNSILRVIDTPKILNDNELSKYYPAWTHKYTLEEWKQDAKDRNYERIYIPVEFLVTTDKHFIMQCPINNWKYDWTFGLRGSNCITPNNPHWQEQVIEMYKYLINK